MLILNRKVTRTIDLFFVMVFLLADCADQMVVETDIPNEVFSEPSYDDLHSDFSIPSSPADSNLTAFLMSQSRNHFAEKTTRSGLDITSPHYFVSKTSAQLYAVFPGTIWCGVGNLGGDNQALGFFSTTDSCCRTHDRCRLTIPSGMSRFGLTNTGYFTRSHCLCDEQFYYCLKQTNSIVAAKVGFTYFNLLRPQCFRKEFPVVACISRYRGRCRTYVVDQSEWREWQWFDNREY